MFIAKEARIEYINPNSDKPLKRYRWEITDMYRTIIIYDGYGESTSTEREYKNTITHLSELHTKT